MGSRDRATVAAAADEVVTRIDLVSSKRRFDHGVGRALDDMAEVSLFPSEMGLDLLVLAALVHASDTRISRFTESQDTWTREIRLVVPVSDPFPWRRSSGLLKQMLDFLTGDLWTIDFRPRPRAFSAVIEAPAEPRAESAFDCVSLFSGGLDSLVGAIDVLEGGAVPLLASHAGEGATSVSQETCYRALKEHYPQRAFDRLRLWMNFPKALVQNVAAEDTTRGRSFLFFALGVFAGTGLRRTFTVRVPENGLIALNVPLDPLRLGSLSTRTTHPFYMARWNDLLASLGISGRIENPYWDKTKGEMVEGCANAKLLSDLIPHSLSCSSPTKGRWHGRGIEHCGYCLPCLIRRAAIEKASGPGRDSTTYAVPDLSAELLDTQRSVGQQVRSFQYAIDRLQAKPELADILIHTTGPLSDQAAHLAGLAGVYRRGLAEVADLLVKVRTQPR